MFSSFPPLFIFQLKIRTIKWSVTKKKVITKNVRPNCDFSINAESAIPDTARPNFIVSTFS